MSNLMRGSRLNSQLAKLVSGCSSVKFEPVGLGVVETNTPSLKLMSGGNGNGDLPPKKTSK